MTGLSPFQKNLTGVRTGRLVGVEPRGIGSTGHGLWLCRCDCGETKVVTSHAFRSKGPKSCGCLRAEAALRRAKRDGPWNEGKSYAIGNGEHCYKTRHAWAKAAIRHYGNRCEICGWKEARCDVHHRKLKSRRGLHTLSNAIVLCPNHHRIEHERKQKRRWNT